MVCLIWLHTVASSYDYVALQNATSTGQSGDKTLWMTYYLEVRSSCASFGFACENSVVSNLWYMLPIYVGFLLSVNFNISKIITSHSEIVQFFSVV